MNINPKKSWHVRSKTNIAKVNRDEAKVAAEEAEKQRRLQLAESDARWSHLKHTANSRGIGIKEEEPDSADLFKDVQRGVDGVVTESSELTAEKKGEQEKWEKNIGLLKYLGEGSAEFSAEKPWWMRASGRASASSDAVHSSIESAIERDRRHKNKEDPLAEVNRSMRKPDEAHRKKTASQALPNIVSPSSSSSQKSVDQLRRERLERERRERERSQALLASRGIIPLPKQTSPTSGNDDDRKRPYNSAFNASISGHLRK